MASLTAKICYSVWSGSGKFPHFAFDIIADQTDKKREKNFPFLIYFLNCKVRPCINKAQQFQKHACACIKLKLYFCGTKLFKLKQFGNSRVMDYIVIDVRKHLSLKWYPMYYGYANMELTVQLDLSEGQKLNFAILFIITKQWSSNNSEQYNHYTILSNISLLTLKYAQATSIVYTSHDYITIQNIFIEMMGFIKLLNIVMKMWW